jgi:hypothetical protein
MRLLDLPLGGFGCPSRGRSRDARGSDRQVREDDDRDGQDGREKAREVPYVDRAEQHALSVRGTHVGPRRRPHGAHRGRKWHRTPLRRTFASLLFVLDTPLQIAKAQMGHTTSNLRRHSRFSERNTKVNLCLAEGRTSVSARDPDANSVASTSS